MAAREEEIKVIVFDLNGTFYNKSSKDEFYKFICTQRPARLKYYLEMVYYKLLLKLHQVRQTEFKENFFNYLDAMPPAQVEAYATAFWKQEYPQNFNKELLRHFDRKRAEGVRLFCATGGLELYVRPLFDLYAVDGFAGTQVKYEKSTYVIEGEACKHEEKIRRMEAHFKGRPYRIVEAYSDSKEVMLDQADSAFLVKKGKLIPYR